jgi:hypothetical protein
VGQKRSWDSERERLRKQAYRERKRREGERVAEQIAELGRERPQPEVENLIRPGPGILTEDEYVRRELAVTRAQVEAGWIKTRDRNGHDLEPLRRSEEYLRWRYRGFRAGEIASL